MKGTQWVIKTPRLKCRCGCTLHFECRGRWAIKYDSAPSEYTLSMSPTKLQGILKEQELRDDRLIKAIEEQEPPPSAKDDSEG
jgi:hypothetical protein